MFFPPRRICEVGCFVQRSQGSVAAPVNIVAASAIAPEDFFGPLRWARFVAW